MFKTKLGNSLGSGRFGQVFQGRNAAYGGSGSVAVKVIRNAAGEVDCKEPFLLRWLYRILGLRNLEGRIKRQYAIIVSQNRVI